METGLATIAADWQTADGRVALFNRDCRDVAPHINRAAVDSLVSDPPYGIGYVHSGAGAKVAGRCSCSRNGKRPIVGDEQPFDPAPWLDFPRVLLFGANHFASKLPVGCWLAWDKAPNGGPDDNFSDCEFAWTNQRTARNVFRVQWKGVCTTNVGERNGARFHPTQKPVALMRQCLRVVAPAAGVFDPYMGSGTTGVAAASLGLPFVGCELDAAYFDAACRRIEQELLRTPLFEPPPEIQRTLITEPKDGTQ